MKWPVHILVGGTNPKKKPCRGATLGTWFGGDPVDQWFIEMPSPAALHRIMDMGGQLTTFGHHGFTLNLPRPVERSPA